MGQCSTLPDHQNGAGNNYANNASPKYQQSSQQQQHGPSNTAYYQQPRQQRDDSHYSTRHGGGEDGPRNENNDVMMDESSGDDSQTPLTSRMEKNSTANMTSFLNVVRQGVHAFDPFLHNNEKNGYPHNNNNGVQLRNTNNSRVYPHDQQRARSEENMYPIAQPPENAVRMRCYRLNLDVDTTLVSSHHHQYGPVEYDPRLRSQTWNGVMNIQASNSEESTTSATASKIAVSTAKIFRGLTISRDGTVTSRKMRGSSHKSKQGEKSRQAAKIDKAKDIVEQLTKKGKKGAHEDDESNMVSLVIMGEYDDMKHLVKDGSKKLKEAEGLPDETLLAINRPRVHNSPNASSAANYMGRSESRKRTSYTPEGPTSKSTRLKIPASTPPRLKGHPRDIPRRQNSNAASQRRFPNLPNQCSELPIFGGGGDSDWSDALNNSKLFNSIWNCGATGGNTGTMSPDPATSPTNHHHHHRYAGEGREPVVVGGGGGGAMSKYDRGRGDNRDRRTNDVILV